MRVKKLNVLIIILFVTGFYSLILSSCENKNDMSVKLNEFMSVYYKNSSYKYSGTILVAKGDEILLSDGYGMANYEVNVPNKPNSVFAIGSISKSFTAVAIMQLQERQLLNVNDPISKYVDGNKRSDDITIHHLLTHTSGLIRDGLMLGALDVSLNGNIKTINAEQLLFEPGEKYSYSNAGYIILADIIEKVSGISYNDYIRDNIFIPLKMESSRGGSDAVYGDNQAIGYEILTDDPKKLSLINSTSIIGCGNIYSTVEDLYKYDRALYDDKLLSKESLEKVFTSYPVSNCGYGWGITERFGHKKNSVNGHIDGYFSSIIRFPDDDFVLIFLTNNTDSTALNAVSDTLEAIVLEQDYVIPVNTINIKIDSEVLEQYSGKYDFGEGLFLSVSHNNGKLYSTADDGNVYELLPINETSFYYEDHQWIKDEFIINKGDNSVTLKIRNAGRVFEGQRVIDN